MSLLDDISMGLGFKKPDDAYHERTAATIENNQGAAAADRYRANNPPSGSGSTTKMQAQPVSENVANAYKQYADSMTQAGLRNLAGSPSLGINDTDSSGNKPVVGSGYDPVTKTGYTNTAGQVVVNEGPNAVQRMVRDSFIGRGLASLGGVDRANDKIVNTVDGKSIYQKKDGTYYAINALGLPYDVAGIDTLAEDPSQVERREEAMRSLGSGDDDGGTGIIDDLLENDSETTDPCPDGYVYDSEQMMCVIDPTTGLMPDLPSIELPDPTVPVSDYTQVASNFIPTPLQPTAPNPIQQQLTQMNRMMRGPQQPQRQRSGLAGANTGIMQVRP
jgi:hypothetical protein